MPHFTGYTWRFAPPFATMRRLLGEGVVGPLRFIDGHFRIGPPLAGKEWQHDPRQRAGGVLGNLGVHLIDLCRAFLLAGGDPAEVEGWRVWARTDLAGREPSGGSGSSGEAREDGGGSAVNDLVWLQLQMGAGRDAPQARLQASQLLTLRAPDPVRVELHGARASLAGYANPLAPEGQRVALWERTSTPAQAVTPLDFPGGPPVAPERRAAQRGAPAPHRAPPLRGAHPAPPAGGRLPPGYADVQGRLAGAAGDGRRVAGGGGGVVGRSVTSP